MVIENEQELASDVESAVQTTVDVPIGNAEPETGEQEPLSTGMPAPMAAWRAGFCPAPAARIWPMSHSKMYNRFNLGHHLVSAKNYRYFRLRAFASWEKAVAM